MRITAAGVNRNRSVCRRMPGGRDLRVRKHLQGVLDRTGQRQCEPAPASTRCSPRSRAQPITAAEVRKALGQNLSKLEEQAYELKKQQIDELIAAAIAGRRSGAAGDDGRRARAAGNHGAASRRSRESDIAAFVAANRSRIPGDPAQYTGQIRSYLEAQRSAAQRQAFVGTLRAKAKVDVRLEAPPVFRAEVATDGAPVRGDVKAPITIVEFSDFHCPFCRSVQPALLQVLAKYPGQVRLVYKHFPLDSLHPQARRASEASWCANEQGKFWEFHDRVYAAGPDASDAALGKFAAEASLDKAAFDACLASGRPTAAIQKDVDEGIGHGINGTPGFFVNGRFLSGNQPLSAFENIIQEELKAEQ